MPQENAERTRLAEATGTAEADLFTANPWYEWGPYLSERAWGTVREDYSADGDAWRSFPHDHARSRAYRWNEDGMAGISDIRHRLCLALALWNGRDPILKERMFGLTGPEGNHGEDVKEYWWYLDALPSHAYLKWCYHYPQAPFPYEQLLNHGRGLGDPELELLDTGVFDEDRYWSVEVTYAKESPTDILMQIDITNHGPDTETLHVLPTLWFRNDWAFDQQPRPVIGATRTGLAVRKDTRLKGYRLDAGPGPDGKRPKPLFCENETNTARLYGTESSPYPKDGINDHVVSGADTVNPKREGSKAALHYELSVAPGQSAQVRLRLHSPDTMATDLTDESYADVVRARADETEQFYRDLGPDLDAERMRVLRQASAGLIWSKQMYPYDVSRWLDGDPGQPVPPAERLNARNHAWRHLDTFDVLAMPDPWEYPWFAAWDLGFHAVAWAHLDPAFAKYQLIVLLREWFQHPNGAMPAYEWNFDDVNPPVHVMAALRVFRIDGSHDREFLERVFQKLLLNFTWWLNREDVDGNNLFSGGFLGLDNISPIDRSNLPEGVTLEQADGTAWMAYYALGMLVIAIALATENPVYEDMVIKFLEHFLQISSALGDRGIYDPEDHFFYDRLHLADGQVLPVKVRSVAGLIPLLPSVALPTGDAAASPQLARRVARIREKWRQAGGNLVGRVREVHNQPTALISVLSPDHFADALRDFFDESSFLSPHGLRSVSRRYLGQPYVVPEVPGAWIDYEPAESNTAMFGGNSN